RELATPMPPPATGNLPSQLRGLTEDLRRDHGDLRGALRVLLAMATHVAEGTFPAADCALVLRFLRDRVHAVHCAKEARHLLPAVAMHGDEREVRAVGTILRLQAEARSLLDSLVLLWEPGASLTAAERSAFGTAARAFVQRTAAAMCLEERIAFPALRRV